MAREYTLTSGAATVTSVAGSLLTMLPSSTVGFEIIRAWISQVGSTTSAQARAQMASQASYYSIAGAATSPQKTKLNDPTPNLVGLANIITPGKCGTICTTEQTGTITTIWDDSFNVLNGWLWVPTPRETLIFPPGCVSAFNLRFGSAPPVTANWSFGVAYVEI